MFWNSGEQATPLGMELDENGNLTERADIRCWSTKPVFCEGAMKIHLPHTIHSFKVIKKTVVLNVWFAAHRWSRSINQVVLKQKPGGPQWKVTHIPVMSFQSRMFTKSVLWFWWQPLLPQWLCISDKILGPREVGCPTHIWLQLHGPWGEKLLLWSTGVTRLMNRWHRTVT